MVVLLTVLLTVSSCSSIGVPFLRVLFNKEADKLNKNLAQYVPNGITQVLDEQYNPNSKSGYLDVYYPDGVRPAETLPTIVWIHGGGWIAGNKDQIANYARILAGNRYTVVVVEYTLAPKEHHPYQLAEINKAIAFLLNNAGRFHINTAKILLAGDSAGASLSAQLAVAISEPSYADLINLQPALTLEQLIGVILYCGPYDINLFDSEAKSSGFVNFISRVYSGEKDFLNAPSFKPVSVARYVTANFPPAFISVGNHDPLQVHSAVLAQTLDSFGVLTDTLFFPKEYLPKLPHEYQFNLNESAGQLALKRTIAFIEGRCKAKDDESAKSTQETQKE